MMVRPQLWHSACYLPRVLTMGCSWWLAGKLNDQLQITYTCGEWDRVQFLAHEKCKGEETETEQLVAYSYSSIYLLSPSIQYILTSRLKSVFHCTLWSNSGGYSIELTAIGRFLNTQVDLIINRIENVIEWRAGRFSFSVLCGLLCFAWLDEGENMLMLLDEGNLWYWVFIHLWPMLYVA